ncbi:hypothetical protein CEXT_34031 [Caerostris extrusa]|uniref:Uncharacterized protein n=1 Tax=Caerostris extrusa TaxID=172846 RepID=A0AAV4Q8R6_CAEEX|nr:hypothetical protein CEXT_34031 [Caerostris extrusa]
MQMPSYEFGHPPCLSKRDLSAECHSGFIGSFDLFRTFLAIDATFINLNRQSNNSLHRTCISDGRELDKKFSSFHFIIVNARLPTNEKKLDYLIFENVNHPPMTLLDVHRYGFRKYSKQTGSSLRLEDY